MYFVDREELALKLDYIDTLSNELAQSEGFALERIAHMLIESVVDVGNMIIDGFIMRDPGSYKDVLDILEMEKVIPVQYAEMMRSTLYLRQWFVRDYINIDHAEVKRVFMENIESYQHFKADVNMFIEHELGPVSAFGKGGKVEEV
ncbi:DUF86 domain-containing protein [Macrococcoides canis]|uniref:DUF86 domain-containing protein n=1 Tax=Macrococcoides canis TaxID=1855823 RepID=A0A4R6C6H4_9STAP|nr:DUF86 domain-containing protein [Macrococcus canis]MEE1107447.1 DUF86 domain-containing protein [Macrococcus canis]TDM17413.1 DUF86 domain-containing protein [Macrococcus canis]TDM20742.1 DUF86 domain-containing protein [Macrococcus canis]TDM24709.1 DUF86 domain-containing protein [Macrococcus canis]TDM32336.1 DUF86 domain-containing protein [Macrococcus canis]